VVYITGVSVVPSCGKVSIFLCCVKLFLHANVPLKTTLTQDETAQLLQEMSAQLKEVLQANKELRAENEYLRRIY